MGRLARLSAGAVLAGLLLAGCSPSARGPDLSALVEAEEALEAGRAVEGRRLLLALPPDDLPDGPSRRRAAAALMKVGEYSRAADLLDKDAPGKGGRNGEAALLRLESLIRSGRSAEAGEHLMAMEVAGHGGERQRVLRAMLDLSAGNPGDGNRELEALAGAGTRDADAWVLWAQAAMVRPDEAERRLLEGLQRATDRGTVLRALGRLLLGSRGDPRRAADALSDAVKLRPWDRETRLLLVSALRRTGRLGDLERAAAEAERLRAEDPGEFGPALALAEVLGETARLKAAAAGGNPSAGGEELARCIALYGEVAGMRVPDPVTGIRVLQGLGRAHVEAIPLDDVGDAGPGSHFAAAMEVLGRARDLDPQGTLRDASGRVLLAETLYLMARAHKRVHVGDGDHTLAVGLYEKALKADGFHLEAAWDLALLYYDFLRSPEYIRKAHRLMEKHVEMRDRMGLPPLDPERQRILDDVRALDGRGEGNPPGGALPPKRPEGPLPPGGGPPPPPPEDGGDGGR